MTTLEVLLLTLAGVGVLVGLLGTVLPVLPGIPLIFLSVLLYAAATGFSHITVKTLIALGVITLVSLIIDALAISQGARKLGASRAGALGALVGGVIGVLVASFPGFVIGLVLGTIAGEVVAGTAPRRIPSAALGALFGLFVSSVARFLLGVAMVAVALADLVRG